MLFDSIQLADGGAISNAIIDSGSSFPASGSTGELFFRTDLNALYAYDGNSWVTAAGGGSGGTFTISGDVSGTIDGVAPDALTLATVNSNVGSFGSSSSVPVVTLNAKGQVTAASSSSIQIAETQITDGSVLARLAANETVSGNWTFSNPVTAATPTADTHLTTKAYVDSVAGGLDPKNACYVATTANVTLSGLQTIDGITLNVGDRILVKNQTNGAQNGIYVAASGAWSRATDFDGTPAAEVSPGAYTFVIAGTTNGATGWVLITTNPITLGTTPLTFSQLSAAPTTAAAGTLTGTTLASNVVSSSLTSVGTVTSGTWNATLGAVSGASLTNLNASNLGSGTVPTARLGTGTASSSTYLRGDGTWTAVASGSPALTSTQIGFGDGSNLLSGSAGFTYESVNNLVDGVAHYYWDVLRLNSQTASHDQKISMSVSGYPNRAELIVHAGTSTSYYASAGDVSLNFGGTLRLSANGGGAGGQPLPVVTVDPATLTLTATNLAGSGTGITNLNASNLTGTVATARLGTGTASSSTYLRGDGTWAAVTAGSTDASTLSGTTLASNVVSSSLTSVGTITTGTWSGSFGSVSGANLTSLNASNLASGAVPAARMSTFLSTANTWTALQTFNGPGAGTFAVGFGAAYTEKQNAPTLAATFPIDCSLGNNFTVSLGATAITAINFTNVPASGTNYSATLYVTQDATGSRSMSLSSVQVAGVAKTIKWAGGTAPTITSTANKIDIFTFVTYDGGNTWLGFIAGQNY